MGKPTICIGENKDADQLRGNREADQRLCFRYSDSTIPPLLNSKISSFYPASVAVQAGSCRTCSENHIVGFPTRRLIWSVTIATMFLPVLSAHFFHHLLKNEPPRGKTNNVVSEQVRHKPACTSTEKS